MSYPRSYGVSKGQRLLWIALGGVVGIAGLVGAFYFGTGHQTTGGAETLIMVSMCIGFVALSIWCALSMLTSKLILMPDALEVRSFVSRREFRRDEIAGYRILPTPYISTLEVISRDKSKKKLKYSMNMRTDESFYAWFAGIPNLDQVELATAEAKLEANLSLGFSRDERSERMKAARSFAKRMDVIALIATFWGFWYPYPYEILILILTGLPLYVLVAVTRANGIYDMEGRRNDARPTLARAYMLPGFALVLRAVLDTQFLEWRNLLLGSLLVSALMTFVIKRADKSLTWPNVVVSFGLTMFYAYGVLAQADTMLDKSPPDVHHVIVQGKRESHGKTTTYYISVETAQAAIPNETSVPRDFYDSVAAGDTVCVFKFPGALKIPWYFVDYCTSQPANSLP